MDQHIRNILIITDIIFTLVLALYFTSRGLANMKDEYKDKWLTAMNGLGSKEWFTEKGWAYFKRSGVTFVLGLIIFLLILILSQI